MGKVAFVFSGQGAQYTGMGKEAYDCSQRARDVFAMADRIRPGTSEQCFTASKAELKMTINTQPCLLAVGLATAEMFREQGVTGDCTAGFSLGEIAALAYGGVMSYETAFILICRRAAFMHEAAEKKEGAMAAVLGLGAEEVEAICIKAAREAVSLGEADVWPVNYNSPKQTVIAGSIAGVDWVCEKIKEAKGKVVKLSVSGAFHSPFMHEAAEHLRGYLDTVIVKKPEIPVYANVTAEPYGEDENEIKDCIAKQMQSPVLWQKTIENMARAGVERFIEVGAGNTLTGLIQKIL